MTYFYHGNEKIAFLTDDGLLVSDNQSFLNKYKDCKVKVLLNEEGDCDLTDLTDLDGVYLINTIEEYTKFFTFYKSHSEVFENDSFTTR